MKLWKLALCAMTASFGMAGAALADGPTFTFNAALTNDYVFRGLSQTFGETAASGGVDMTMGIGYAGAWVSNVDFGKPYNPTSMETDFYGGVRPVLGPVTLDVGVIYYGYVNAPSGSHEAYWEGKIAATAPMGPLTVGGAFYYSPEFFADTGQAEYYEVNAAYTFPNKASVSGAVGFQDFDEDEAGFGGYTTWNVGVGYPVTDHIAVDLRYWGTGDNVERLFTDLIAGDRIAGTLKVTF